MRSSHRRGRSRQRRRCRRSSSARRTAASTLLRANGSVMPGWPIRCPRDRRQPALGRLERRRVPDVVGARLDLRSDRLRGGPGVQPQTAGDVDDRSAGRERRLPSRRRVLDAGDRRRGRRRRQRGRLGLGTSASMPCAARRALRFRLPTNPRGSATAARHDLVVPVAGRPRRRRKLRSSSERTRTRKAAHQYPQRRRDPRVPVERRVFPRLPEVHRPDADVVARLGHRRRSQARHRAGAAPSTRSGGPECTPGAGRSFVSGWPSRPSGRSQSPALADLTGDGVAEVLVATSRTRRDPYLYAFSCNEPRSGRCVPGAISRRLPTSKPRRGGRHGDGQVDILVAVNTEIAVISRTGAQLTDPGRPPRRTRGRRIHEHVHHLGRRGDRPRRRRHARCRRRFGDPFPSDGRDRLRLDSRSSGTGSLAGFRRDSRRRGYGPATSDLRQPELVQAGALPARRHAPQRIR